jgi:hypothetical protein
MDGSAQLDKYGWEDFFQDAQQAIPTNIPEPRGSTAQSKLLLTPIMLIISFPDLLKQSTIVSLS